jgi:hypothetical protein
MFRKLVVYVILLQRYKAGVKAEGGRSVKKGPSMAEFLTFWD